MKKKLLIALLTALCIVASTFGVTSAFASNEKYDGETNLAVDSSLWTPSWFTTHYNFVTMDENGILFDSYGTESAVGAVSLKDALPYEGKINITFNSESTNANGFLKVVFADASGTPDGMAMKFWEIANGAEHLALEIQTNSVTAWQYQVGGASSGNHNQLNVASGTANYIDGEDHVITIEYKTSETAYDLKLSIDETVHYEGSIASTNLYCGSVLTLGGYSSSGTVTDNLHIKSVTIKEEGEAPAPVIDEDNLLGKADLWEIAESDVVTYDATTATLTAGASDGALATLLESVPAEAKITFKVEYKDLPAEAIHRPVVKVRIIDTPTAIVDLSLDDDGNVWLQHDDKNGKITSQGDWAPGLLAAASNVVITITPALTDGDEGVYVEALAGGKVIGLMVNDVSLVAKNQLAFGFGGSGTAVITSVKVEDLLVEKEGTAMDTTDLTGASNWACVSSTFEDGKIKLGGQDYLDGKVAIPVDSVVEFTINGTADANAWYYLGFGNFHSQLWDGLTFEEGQARFRIVTTGTQGFYLLDLNYTSIAKASSDTTLLFDGNDQHFKWVTESLEEGLKVTLFRNDVEEFSEVYGYDTAMGASKQFYFMFRATGAHTADPVITDVKYSVESTIDYTEYNAAVAIKRAIYGLEIPTEENAAEVKAQAESLIADLDNEFVDNVLYAEHIIDLADAQLAVVADKAAAQPVIDFIDGLAETYATITADNVDQAEIDLVDAQDMYDALTDAQKAYVTNVGTIESIQIAIDEYKLSLEPESTPEESTPVESIPEVESNPEESTPAEESKGGSTSSSCSGSVSLPAIFTLLAFAGVVTLIKKKN